MRTSLLAVTASLLLANVCAADDRQWYVNTLTRLRSGIYETETYINDFVSDKNFPADVAVGTTGDLYRDIELLESQMETVLVYNGKFVTYLNVLHIRVMNMNSVLADRQRDLQIKMNESDGPYRPTFLNLKSLNEVTKASWHARRALLVAQLQTLEQISNNLVQLRFAAHGFKEQILAAEPFPEHLALVKKEALAKLAAGSAEVNSGLAQLKALSRPQNPPVTGAVVIPTPPVPEAGAPKTPEAIVPKAPAPVK
jgi:hypothetical protein